MYNYSCQAGSYYRSTLESYYNTTTKGEVVDVEKETTTGASTSLPPLRAPRADHLVDWHDVKDYLIDNLIKAHKNYDLKLPSKTMKAYYNTLSDLLLPPATDGDDDSETEEELQSMMQTHRFWEPLHEKGTLMERRPTHIVLGWRRTTCVAEHREEGHKKSQNGNRHSQGSTNTYIFLNNRSKPSTTL